MGPRIYYWNIMYMFVCCESEPQTQGGVQEHCATSHIVFENMVCHWCRRTASIRKIYTRSGPQYGMQNYKEFIRKNKGFKVSAGAEDSADSQNIHQEWAPVWDAKCKEFMRKIKDFRCQWGRRTAQIRKIYTKSGPQYGMQNVRNS